MQHSHTVREAGINDERHAEDQRRMVEPADRERVMADEEGRKRRLAREYLTCTPILEVAVQQVLRRATHIAPEARQRLAESRPGLRRDVDQVVFNLLVEHFTIEELNHQVQWMTSRLGRSWLDKQPDFWGGIGDAIQPLVERAIGDIRGAEGGA